MANSVRYRAIRSEEGDLTYLRGSAYSSKVIYVARRKSAQFVEQQANALLPRYKKMIADKQRKAILDSVTKVTQNIITEGEIVADMLGAIITENGHKIIAKDKYGSWVEDALMLYYDTERDITVKDFSVSRGERNETKLTEKESFTTKTLCFIDLGAKISANSSKNIVLTQVQGRDFTRKELVSGGDITFSVSGKIVSNEIDVYPDGDVKKFIEIMQHGGIVKVNQTTFQQFNVKQILIKDFSLGAVERKNEQPYNFTCVAVETDKDVSVSIDTIGLINKAIAESSVSAWERLILSDKLDRIVNNNIVTNVSEAFGKSLDVLIPNI